MKRRLNPWALARFAWVLACFSQAAGAEGPIPISEIRSLPRNQLASAVPVRARGVVTYVNLNGDFALQDDSGGIWVHLFLSQQRKLWRGDASVLPSIREGTELEVAGLTHTGGYSPAILPQTVRIIGSEPLPAARPLDRTSFFSGAEAAQRVEAHGVLLDYEPMRGGWKLRLQDNSDTIYVMAFSKVVPDPKSLLDAELRVRGVAASGFNTREEQLYARIVVSLPGDVVAVSAPPLSPFSIPLVPIDQINAFRSRAETPHRLRVAGTVTFALPGKFIYIQEGIRAVRIETRSTVKLAAGDRVEAVGYVDMSRHIAMLRGAEVRKVGTGVAPAPISITPEEVMRINTVAAVNGQPPVPHDFDGHLIRFRAQLLAIQSQNDAGQPSRKLVIKEGGVIAGAILYEGDSTLLDDLRTGSELELTGLVRLEYAESEGSYSLLSPARLDVILPSARDVVVMRAPPWWTAQRLLGLLSVILLTLAGTLFWISQLRRQVQRKTQELAAEMSARKDAAIEFKATLRERNRLAANLHDTILQTIGGIGFQIEVCEAESALLASNGAANKHFAVARSMLDHAADELRGSVWALRSLPQQGLTLTEALSAMAERAGTGQSAQVQFRIPGALPPVPDFVAGNLLLAAQEAVHNSLKHGNPKNVWIEIRPTGRDSGLEVTIHDDGVGFTPGKEPGAAQGHFGLSGMRERIEGLDGKVHIQSEPGMGTTLRIEVPLRTYDRDLT